MSHPSLSIKSRLNGLFRNFLCLTSPRSSNVGQQKRRLQPRDYAKANSESQKLKDTAEKVMKKEQLQDLLNKRSLCPNNTGAGLSQESFIFMLKFVHESEKCECRSSNSQNEDSE